MPPSITEKPLFDYFSRFGPVKGVNVVRDKWTGISRGFGFVRCSKMKFDYFLAQDKKNFEEK